MAILVFSLGTLPLLTLPLSTVGWLTVKPGSSATSLNQALRFRGFCCSGSLTLIKKERKPKINVNIFVFSGPWHQRLPETCSLFAQTPLLIDLWIKECQILMIFYYFSWKLWRSPSQDLALDTNKNHFGGRSFQICLNKYKHCWVLIFLCPNILLSCW